MTAQYETFPSAAAAKAFGLRIAEKLHLGAAVHPLDLANLIEQIRREELEKAPPKVNAAPPTASPRSNLVEWAERGALPFLQALPTVRTDKRLQALIVWGEIAAKGGS